jgi:hypothetical protein
LLELLIAMSIMLMIVGTLAGLAKGVQLGFEHGEAYGTVTQHARVALQRITRAVNEATATKQFPGFLVVAEYDGSYRFPEALVVWRPAKTTSNPTGKPARSDGLPQVNELVLFCPQRGQPNSLLEITETSDTTAMPSLDPTGSSYSANLATWQAKVVALRQSTTATQVQLTSLLRTASLSSYAARGVVRFESRMIPSDTLMQTKTWAQLQAYCAQGVYGPSYGLRQAWMRVELQLKPQTMVDVTADEGLYAVPFFGSAAVYYTITP